MTEDRVLKALQATDRRTTRLHKGKQVHRIFRHRSREVIIEFSDGSRLAIDETPEGLELSTIREPKSAQ